MARLLLSSNGTRYMIPEQKDLADIPGAFKAFADSIPKFPAFPSLSGYSRTNHNHSALYAPKSHTHPAAQVAFAQHSAGGSFRVGSKDNWRSTPYKTVLTGSIKLPPGTWTVVVTSDGQFATLGPPRSGAQVQVNSKVGIAGHFPSANLSPGIREGGHFQPIASHSRTGLKGTVAVVVQYKLNDNVGKNGIFGALRFVEATWQAFRTA